MAQSEPEQTFTMFPKLPREIRLMVWKFALPGPRVVDLRQRKLKKTIGEWEIETGKSWPLTAAHIEAEDIDEDGDSFSVDLRESAEWQREDWSLLRYALGGYKHDDDAYKAGRLLGYMSESPPPEILNVCRESFEVVSKSYHRIFSSLGSIPTTWFNFDIDTLYLRHDKLPVYLVSNGLQSIVEELSDGAFRPLDMDNLSRVRNLAILLDEQDHGELSLEVWIAEILRVFSCLDKLSLVVKHYGKDNDDQRRLSIVEPIDVDETFNAYEMFDPEQWEYGAEVPSEVGLETSEADVNLRDLRNLLDEDDRGGASPLNIPKIEKKVVVDRDLIEDMENLRSDCEKRLDEVIDNYDAYDLELI